MFIEESELKNKLNHSSNLINILTPILGNDTVKKIDDNVQREIVKESINDKDIETLIDGVQINHNGERRLIGHAGKVEGDSNVPQVIRNVVGIQANFDKVSNVAERWGLSKTQVRNYKDGIVNRDRDENDPSNKATSTAVNKVIDRVNDKVLCKIEKILDKIDDGSGGNVDNLTGLEAKTLSVIGANLSRIMASTMPKDKGNGNENKVQVIFMNPNPVDAPKFKTIEVGA